MLLLLLQNCSLSVIFTPCSLSTDGLELNHTRSMSLSGLELQHDRAVAVLPNKPMKIFHDSPYFLKFPSYSVMS